MPYCRRKPSCWSQCTSTVCTQARVRLDRPLSPADCILLTGLVCAVASCRHGHLPLDSTAEDSDRFESNRRFRLHVGPYAAGVNTLCPCRAVHNACSFTLLPLARSAQRHRPHPLAQDVIRWIVIYLFCAAAWASGLYVLYRNERVPRWAPTTARWKKSASRSTSSWAIRSHELSCSLSKIPCMAATFGSVSFNPDTRCATGRTL